VERATVQFYKFGHYGFVILAADNSEAFVHQNVLNDCGIHTLHHQQEVDVITQDGVRGKQVKTIVVND
jgi:cold shock CspA family protein